METLCSNLKHTGIFFTSTNKYFVSLFGDMAAFLIYLSSSHFWKTFLHSREDNRSDSMTNRSWQHTFISVSPREVVEQLEDQLFHLKGYAPASKNKESEIRTQYDQYYQWYKKSQKCGGLYTLFWLFKLVQSFFLN